MHTAEREAYFIHEMHRAGKTNTEISKELNILQSKVSKILYGTLKVSSSIFIQDGENLLGRKRYKHTRLTNIQKKYLYEKIKSGDILFPDIKKLFEERFKRDTGKFHKQNVTKTWNKI